eukprot:COSAG01_NODE_41917_length_445_cov_5.205202_2_plen_29_part_01
MVPCEPLLPTHTMTCMRARGQDADASGNP